MKIGLVSFNPIWLEPRVNLQNTLDLLDSKTLRNCDLIVFPEMTLTGFSPQHGCLGSEFIHECISSYCSAAIKNKSFIIFGALSYLDSDCSNSLPTNNAYVVSPTGTLISSYSKIHLFSAGDEQLFVRPGNLYSSFLCGGINCSLSICYDLRFPDIYSRLASSTHLFINISSWPSQRTDHWHALLKARAIETQSYMVGVNRTGKDGNNLSYDFSSSVYDPIGRTLPLTRSIESDLVSCVNVDFSIVDHTRSVFGVLNDKRHSLYQSLFPIT